MKKTIKTLLRLNVKKINKLLFITFIVIGLVLFIGGSVFAYPSVKKIYLANKNEKIGDNNFSQKKFQEALINYEQSKDFDEDIKINEKISKTEQLIEDEKHYGEGNNLLIKEDWEKAILEFSKVSSKYEMFGNAEKLSTFAKNKIEEANRERDSNNDEVDDEINQILGTTTETTDVVTNIPIEPVKQTVYVSALNKSVNCKTEGVDAIKSASEDYQDTKNNYESCAKGEPDKAKTCAEQCSSDGWTVKSYCLKQKTGVSECLDQSTKNVLACIDKCKANIVTNVNLCLSANNPDLKLGNLNRLVIQYCD